MFYVKARKQVFSLQNTDTHHSSNRIVTDKTIFGVHEMQRVHKYAVALCVILVRMYVKMCDWVIGKMNCERANVCLHFVSMRKQLSLIQKIQVFVYAIWHNNIIRGI